MKKIQEIIPKIYLILIIPLTTTAIAQIFFKKEVVNLDFSADNLLFLIPQILLNPWLVSGIILFGISFLVYLFVLSHSQLSVIYPIAVSIGIVIIAIASLFIFQEILSLFQIIGIAFIILGILLLANKK